MNACTTRGRVENLLKIPFENREKFNGKFTGKSSVENLKQSKFVLMAG